MPSFSEGDFVTYKASPSWGVGIVKWAPPTGLLVVRFDDIDPPYEGEFHPKELKNVAQVKAAA